jgi:hypothetical protein
MKYVPFLKVKQGELAAVKNLSENIIAEVKPYHLFLNDSNKDRAGEYLESLIKPLVATYKDRGNSFFTDFSIFTDYQSIHMYELLRHHGLDFTIVAENLNLPSDSAEYLKNTNLFGNGLALKLTASNDYKFDVLNKRIRAICEYFDIQSSDVDLIIDFGYVTPGNLGLFTSRFEKFQFTIKNFDHFRSVVILSGSFPKDMTGIAVDTIHELPLLEMEIFQALASLSSRELIYGDYGNIHPVLNPESAKFSGSCTIKYTTSRAYKIYRGTKPDMVAQGTRQYVEKCQLIVAADDYDGPAFSFGDKEIQMYAEEKKKGNGSSTTWITNTLNHHITKLASELS